MLYTQHKQATNTEGILPLLFYDLGMLLYLLSGRTSLLQSFTPCWTNICSDTTWHKQSREFNHESQIYALKLWEAPNRSTTQQI